MTSQPERDVPFGPERQSPALWCRHCGSDTHLFISSIVPLWPVFDGAVQVSYSCTACAISYRHLAEVAQFAGALNPYPGSSDLLLFSGHYIHCGQSLQEIASGVLRFSNPLDPDGESTDVRLEIRVLECPCGFRLVLPD